MSKVAVTMKEQNAEWVSPLGLRICGAAGSVSLATGGSCFI